MRWTAESRIAHPFRAEGFTVQGPYGELKAWPDGKCGPNRETTYWVDSTYRDDLGQSIHQRQRGFRLSTVICMCACICLGEKAIDLELIQVISEQFDVPYDGLDYGERPSSNDSWIH